MLAQTTLTRLKSTPVAAFRYPGGSWADTFDWTNLRFDGMPTTGIFMELVSRFKADPDLITNYGSGTPQMGAAWVAYCDSSPRSEVVIGVDSTGRDWKTAGYWAALRGQLPLAVDDGLNLLRVHHPTCFNVKWIEVGNECYGDWEYDTHLQKHDPVLYAQFFVDSMRLMKKVTHFVKVGAVVEVHEDGYGDGQESVINPVTKKVHSGWSAVLLSTLHALSVVPDYVIYHYYPQAPGKEDDKYLLHVSQATWPQMSQSIRTMLVDYLGEVGQNIPLHCTENNSVDSNPGKQSTSIVDGLYYADSFGSLLQTDFSSLYWWDLHNGIATNYNNSPSLYGWRQYGDYSLLSAESIAQQTGLDEPYPSYFALELLGKFCAPGDIPVEVTTDSPDLAVYAVRPKHGGLNLLIINKSEDQTLNAQFSIIGTPVKPSVSEWYYGKQQDTEQSEDEDTDIQHLTAPVAETSFPPYSITVIQMSH